MAIVKLEDVHKRFGRMVAMDGISLEIPRGVVFALLGENGAGKTTTLRTLLGLERPDRGTIRVLDSDPQRDGLSIRRQVGYVADDPALYDWMRVSQLGWFASGFYPAGYETEYGRLISELGVSPVQKIRQLSRGGRAKVALALALAHRPELLVLDEPTSGLDTLVRRKFLESMVDVAAEGRTVLLSSHQIPEVERVADHVAMMHAGRVLVCEKLDSLKQKVERWVVTVADPTTELPAVELEMLREEGVGQLRRQWMVRDPSPDALWQLRDHPAVREVEVHTPSLEEIFVAYLLRASASESGVPEGLPNLRIEEAR